MFEAGAGLYAWMTTQRAWRESCCELAARLPVSIEPQRVVDLGCGAGGATLEFARLRPGDTVAGVDIAWGMLRRARRPAIARRLDRKRLTWIRADGADLPFKTNTIDVVTGHSVLYLVANRPAVLKECLRVLRPGGRLIVMEPSDCAPRLRDVLALSADPRFLLSIALWCPIAALYGRFVPESLEATVRAAGFASWHVSETLSGLGLCAYAHKATGERMPVRAEEYDAAQESIREPVRVAGESP
jgi:ubiquinone/menaquinone biosynthesis C-methylase UbiE